MRESGQTVGRVAKAPTAAHSPTLPSLRHECSRLREGTKKLLYPHICFTGNVRALSPNTFCDLTLYEPEVRRLGDFVLIVPIYTIVLKVRKEIKYF